MSGEKLEELNLTLVIQREETPPPLTPEITPGWNVEESSGRALHSVCGDEKQVHVCIATDKRRYPTDAGSSGLPPPPLHKTNRTVTMILTDGNKQGKVHFQATLGTFSKCGATRKDERQYHGLMKRLHKQWRLQ